MTYKIYEYILHLNDFLIPTVLKFNDNVHLTSINKLYQKSHSLFRVILCNVGEVYIFSSTGSVSRATEQARVFTCSSKIHKQNFLIFLPLSDSGKHGKGSIFRACGLYLSFGTCYMYDVAIKQLVYACEESSQKHIRIRFIYGTL